MRDQWRNYNGDTGRQQYLNRIESEGFKPMHSNEKQALLSKGKSKGSTERSSSHWISALSRSLSRNNNHGN